ncbi:T9SS type B sorting domain-containing protein, partial [Lutibacter sp.]
DFSNTTGIFSGLTAGTYTVYVQDSNDCSDSDPIEVTITEPTQIIIDAGPNKLITCSNPTATLTGSASIDSEVELSYFWTTTEGIIDSGANTLTPIVSAPGIYILTVVANEECSVSDEVIVTQNISAPEVDIIAEATELTCEVTSITLTSIVTNIQGNLSFLWSKNLELIDGETTSGITISTPGEYMVVVIDSESGCLGVKKIVITENRLDPEAIITGNTVLTCDTTEVTLDASTSTVQGTVSYLWNTGATTSTIGVVEPGVYEVTVTDTENGCSAIATVEVIENTTNVEAVIIGNDELTCSNTEVTLDASTSVTQGEASYLWNTGATTSTIGVVESGVYEVTVTDTENGCSAIATVEVIENTTNVEAVITGNDELTCSNTEVTLDASTSITQGEASYLWSNGETTATIAVTEPGSYSVIVSDTSSGCSGSTTVEISQDMTPQEITGDSIDLCIEDEAYDLTNLLGDNFVSGGTWVDVNNSGGLSGDFFDPSIVNLESFQFIYTEPGDCGRIITVVVNVNDDCVVLACSTEELTISKVITPNNDGINDTFDLLGLEDCGFTFNVQVFNRWGKMVFQSNNYQNTWRGYPNVSGLTIGSSTILPTGTYYYIVNVLSSGFKPITGYIYLGTH